MKTNCLGTRRPCARSPALPAANTKQVATAATRARKFQAKAVLAVSLVTYPRMLVILTFFPFVLLATLASGSSSNTPAARRDASANTHSVQLTRRKTPLLASLARTRGKYGFATAAKRARRRVRGIAAILEAKKFPADQRSSRSARRRRHSFDRRCSRSIVRCHRNRRWTDSRTRTRHGQRRKLREQNAWSRSEPHLTFRIPAGPRRCYSRLHRL